MARSSCWRASTCSTWRAERAGIPRRRSRWGGIASLLAGALLAGASPAAAARLPALWLGDLQGVRMPLDSLRAGRPALLLFWSTPCQSCLDKLRAVEDFAGERALNLLLVNVDAPRNKNLIAPFLHRFGFAAPCYLDPDRVVFRRLGGREAPYLVLVSGAGELLYRSGALSRADLRAIAAHLDQPPLPGDAR